MIRKRIRKYAVAVGMSAILFVAGAGGIQRANAAETADHAGSAQSSETMLQSETAQESETERQSETTQQSEESRQTEALPLKNVKKAPKLSGKWVKQNGKVRFLLPDQTYATGTWANIKGKYYYFRKNGFRRRGFFQYSNGKTYYLGKNGVMVTGWQKIKKKWYYFGKNGAMKKAAWVKTKDGYAYVNAKGQRVISNWVKVNGKKYYIDEKGIKVTKSRYIGKKACYFDKQGVYHKNKKIKERLINLNGKMVALTFDDGPGPYTDRLLKCLKNNRAVATFFLVGTNIGNYKDTIKKMDKQGCEIGNHTMDHPQLSSLSASGIQNQIEGTNSKIRAITGHGATLVRPPYGAYNGTVQANAGLPLILWSIDTLDWKTRNAQNTINVVMNEVKDGSIILMHDIHSPSVDAAEVLIPKLIASGYQLVTVSELAKYRGVSMKQGGVYDAFYR